MVLPSGSIWMMVSADGMAVSTASYLFRASTVSLIMREVTNGRTASWKMRLVSPDISEYASIAERLDSYRSLPPERTFLTFVQWFWRINFSMSR